MDVALFKVVVVYLDRARDSLSRGVDNPGGKPLTTPEALEVQVVARYLDTDLAAIGVRENAVLSCTLTEKTIEVIAHGLNDVYSEGVN